MFGIIEDGTYRVERIGFSTPELTEGYVVAVRPLQHESDIVTEGALFGRWTDEDGTVYWDEVEIYEDRWNAVLLADTRNELAIWDIAGNCEIRLDRDVVSDAWDEMVREDILN